MIYFDLTSLPILIIIAVVALILLIYLIYFLVTSYKDKAFIANPFKDDVKNYSIIYNSLRRTFIFYLKEDNIIKEFKFDDFVAHIDEPYRRPFLIYFNKIAKQERNFDESIIIVLKNLFIYNEEKILKIDFYDLYSNEIYFNGKEISERTKRNIEKADEIEIDEIDEFIKKCSEKINGNNYYIISINFHLFNVIDRRYGEGVSKRYIKQVYEYLEYVGLKNCILGHNYDDHYLIYAPYILFKSLNSSVLNKIKNRLPNSIIVDNYQFELKPTFGVAYYRSFSYEVKTLIDFSDFASNHTMVDKNVRFYDYELNNLFKENLAKTNKIKNVKYNATKLAKFYSITSLDGGRRLGYLSDLEVSDNHFNNFDELYKYADSLNQGESLIERSINGMINKFITFKNIDVNHLFVKCDIKNIKAVIKVVEDNPNFEKINLSILFYGYPELFEHSEEYEKYIDILKKKGVLLGIVADERMESTLSNILMSFTWLVMPQYILESVKDNKKLAFEYRNIIKLTERYNLEPMALNVFDYNTAEVLKDIGVRYLGNSLLDNRDPNISLRKISKLVEERED